MVCGLPVTAEVLSPCPWGPSCAFGFVDLTCFAQGCNSTSPTKRRVKEDGREVFDEEARPQRKPDDELFTYEFTRIVVTLTQGSTPSEMMNAVLHVLRPADTDQPQVKGGFQIDDAAPIEVKQDADACSVRAMVRMGTSFCDVKVRFFSDEPEHVAEFQFRGGDREVFDKVYALACSHLQSESCRDFCEARPIASPLVPGDHNLPCLLPPLGGEVARGMFISDMEELQAESALALAEIAESEPVHLLDPGVYSKIWQLLESDRIEVALPTVRILQILQAKEEAAELFDPDLRSKLREKLVSDHTDQLVINLIERILESELEKSAQAQEESVCIFARPPTREETLDRTSLMDKLSCVRETAKEAQRAEPA